MWKSLLVVMLLWAVPAEAQFSTQAYDQIFEEGVALPRRRKIDCIGAGVICADNAITGRTDITVGGGGSTHNIISATHPDTTGTAAAGDLLRRNSGNTDWEPLPVGANGEVLTLEFGLPEWAAAGAAGTVHIGMDGEYTGAVAIYLGGTVDQVEDRAQMRVTTASSYANLNCTTNEVTPDQDVTITGRTGVCGTLLDDTDDGGDGVFACTISGSSVCVSANEMDIVANECWDLEVDAVATLGTNVVVTCSMERSG